MISSPLAAALAGASAQPFPPIPTRAQVCQIRETFQGLIVPTVQYGLLPWFDAALFSLTPDDRQAVYAAKLATGHDTHCTVTFDDNPGSIYDEPDQPYQQMNGPAFALHPQAFIAAVVEVIHAGFFVDCVIGGDGPQGAPIAMRQLAQIVPLLKTGYPGVDLTRYVIIRPGWDSVFYGWEPTSDLVNFGEAFRALCPDGYLSIEHNSGHIPIGNGASDWFPNGPMATFDTILSEVDYPPSGDTIWQVAARLLGPAYVRPADQPAHDDPPPAPWYLATGTLRGPYFAIAYEWEGEYVFVRTPQTPPALDQASALCASQRAYLAACGYARNTG